MTRDTWNRGFIDVRSSVSAGTFLLTTPVHHQRPCKMHFPLRCPNVQAYGHLNDKIEEICKDYLPFPGAQPKPGSHDAKHASRRQVAIPPSGSKNPTAFQFKSTTICSGKALDFVYPMD